MTEAEIKQATWGPGQRTSRHKLCDVVKRVSKSKQQGQHSLIGREYNNVRKKSKARSKAKRGDITQTAKSPSNRIHAKERGSVRIGKLTGKPGGVKEVPALMVSAGDLWEKGATGRRFKKGLNPVERKFGLE